MFGDGIEHGLQFGRRAAYDREDITCRRLLFQRLSQLAVADLQFIKQAHVLDRDHRLVGECGDQFDLLVCKGLD